MCDGLTIKNPDGTTTCIPIFVEVPEWPPHWPGPLKRFDDLEWLEQATVIEQVAKFGSNLPAGQLRDALAMTIDAARADLQQALPSTLELGDQFGQLQAFSAS